MSGGISIHCVDVAQGRLAAGLKVSVYRLDSEGNPVEPELVHGKVGDSGLLQHPVLMSDAITAGGYEVRFAVGDYCRSQGHGTGVQFLEMVPYRFHIADAAQHYHLPFKFTAWGFSLFRGGA